MTAVDVRLDCNKCGVVLTTVWPQNHWQQDELLRRHAIDKHGGVDR